MLGIATRKAGTEIECPKCGLSQMVPAPEAAAAALMLEQSDSAQVTVDDPSELVVYEDEPTMIGPRRQPPAPATENATSARTPSPPADTLPADTSPADMLPQYGEPLPSGMILFPRRTFFVQGILWVVFGVLAFGAGYFIGRGDVAEEKLAQQEEAARERVLVEGRLMYDPGTGQLAPDEGAVVIVLPEDRVPETPLSVYAIRPQDPPPKETHKSVRLIQNLGGVYTRAAADGTFSFVVPDQGEYYVLLISSHAARAKDAPLDEADQIDIQRFFGDSAEHLINRFKYRWSLEEIHSGFNPIEVNFGGDG